MKEKKPRLKHFSNRVCRIAIVYTLYNKYEDKYYIGQSVDGTNRMFDHSSDLFNNRHRNTGLQNAFNLLKDLNKDPYEEITCDIEYYEVVMTCDFNSPQYESLKQKFFNMEYDLIQSYKEQGKAVYNSTDKKEKLTRPRSTKFSNKQHAYNARPCTIAGKHFPSVLAVSIAYSCTTATVKRRLDDPENPDWIYTSDSTSPPVNNSTMDLSKKIRFHDPISGKTHNFESLEEAYQSLKRLRSQNRKAYHNARIYASPVSILKRCNDPKNKIFEWIQSENDPDNYKKRPKIVPKKVWHNNIIYPSKRNAAKMHGVAQCTIARLCDNENNSDWYFI